VEDDLRGEEPLYENYFSEAGEYAHFQKAQYVDFRTYLPCDALRKVDIASMANAWSADAPLGPEGRAVCVEDPERLNIRKIKGHG